MADDDKEAKGKRSAEIVHHVLQKCSSMTLLVEDSVIRRVRWMKLPGDIVPSSDVLVFADRSIYKEVIMPGKGTMVASQILLSQRLT